MMWCLQIGGVKCHDVVPQIGRVKCHDVVPSDRRGQVS